MRIACNRHPWNDLYCINPYALTLWIGPPRGILGPDVCLGNSVTAFCNSNSHMSRQAVKEYIPVMCYVLLTVCHSVLCRSDLLIILLLRVTLLDLHNWGDISMCLHGCWENKSQHVFSSCHVACFFVTIELTLFASCWWQMRLLSYVCWSWVATKLEHLENSLCLENSEF